MFLMQLNLGLSCFSTVPRR